MGLVSNRQGPEQQSQYRPQLSKCCHESSYRFDTNPRPKGYRDQSKRWERKRFKVVVRRAVLKTRFTERDRKHRTCRQYYTDQVSWLGFLRDGFGQSGEAIPQFRKKSS